MLRRHRRRLSYPQFLFRFPVLISNNVLSPWSFAVLWHVRRGAQGKLGESKGVLLGEQIESLGG